MASNYERYKEYMRRGGAVTQSPAARDANAGVTYSSGGGRGGGGGNADAAPRQSPLEWGIDIISRPLYAMTGMFNHKMSTMGSAASSAMDDVRSGKRSAGEAVSDLLPAALGVNADPLGTLKAGWRGFTSTDHADKKYGVDIFDNVGGTFANLQGKKYVAPTLDNVESWGDFGAAVGRGAVGFGVDVALDPLTYGTLGVVPAIKAGVGAARKTSAAARGAKDAARVAEEAPSVARGAHPVDAIAPPQGIPQKAPAPAAQPAPAMGGAANVATRSAKDVPSSTGAFQFPKVANPSAGKLPKVSETINTHKGGAVNALVKVGREVDKLTTSPAKTARATPTPVAAGSEKLGDFARTFFSGSDEVVGQLRLPGGGASSNIFPSNIIKGLSAENPQAVSAYWNRLVQSAKASPESTTPQMREFLTAASRWQQERRAALPSKNPALPQSAEAVAETGADRSALLAEVLRSPSGKVTPLGAELKRELGDKIFNQLASKRTNPDVRARIFDELSVIAKDADSVSPTTFDGMHENVRAFIEDRLELRRVDFDMEARQKLANHELFAAEPKVIDRKTARSVDPETLRGAEALTGLSHRDLANRYDSQAARIAGGYFDPSKGKWEGGSYVFKTDDGRRYVIEDGKIGNHAFTTWADGARKAIDAAIEPVSSGKFAGQVFATMKTAARREQLPQAIRKVEEALDASGVPMSVKVAGEEVPYRPSHVYDSADDILREVRGTDVEKVLQGRLDTVLFNPGTAVPDSLFHEAMGASVLGKSDAEILEILGRTKSAYNGVEIKRQPLGVGRAGGQYLRNKYTSEQLREIALDTIKRLTPGVASRGAGMSRYVEKSISDASAIATKTLTEASEALAKGDGKAFEYLAGIEKRLVELSRDYGASGHAVGLAAEQVSQQLPPWAVRRAKSVRSTQTAYVNAARAGSTVAEMRRMGAVSEIRHTPVEVHAAADDAEWMMKQADEFAQEGDELYGLGTNAASVITEEMQGRALWQQMVHRGRSAFDGKYGAVVDGIDMTEAGRYAMGSAAKDIYYRSLDITEWAKKHNTVRIGNTNETVGSAAFKLLQQGVDTVPPEMLSLPHGAHVAEALADLRPVAGAFFDVDGAKFAGDLYWRAGSQNIRYLERSMETAGLTKKYGDVFSDDLLNGTVYDWWRKVDVENPAEFLHQYNTAVHHALGERVAMLRLTDTLKSNGLMSLKAQPGFVKPKLEGDSFFYAGLHESGAYIDKRVLDAMSEVDKKIYAARSFSPDGFLSKAIDPALNAWKTGMTIYRPGHHVRNTLSNGMLAFVDQGARNLGKSGYVAARLMAMREGNRGIAGLGELERLLTGAQSGIKGNMGAEVAYSTKLPNGKKVDITYDSLNDAFSARGGYRTFMQSEDIVRGKGLGQKAADLATFKGTRVEKVAAGVSEGLDHHGYLQHFTQIVMNNANQLGRKYKSLDELYDFAIKRAYRFHPDAAVLTPFEAKYVRRMIPFYTWFRGTLPGVVETSIMHPGRVAVAHKASFNTAQTFGIDAESYANPFPEDAEIPEYLREGVFGANAKFGDQMYVLNPGFAHQDLARMFFGRAPEEGSNFLGATLSNAGRELIGMSNPLARVPVELAAGVKLQSGQKIHSKGDYIDETLPHINYLTSGSGISFTDNLLDPFGAMANGRPHERSQVDRGYQPSIFDEGLGENQHRKVLNWLFGQGAQPVDTAEQAADKKTARNERLASRDGGSEAQAGSGMSSAESRVGSPSSALGELRIPKGAEFELPAELDISAVEQYVPMLEGSSGKKLTASQRLSAARSLREDELRRQSAMNWTDYASSSLKQLSAENPDLSLSELLQILKYTTPNPYK